MCDIPHAYSPGLVYVIELWQTANIIITGEMLYQPDILRELDGGSYCAVRGPAQETSLEIYNELHRVWETYQVKFSAVARDAAIESLYIILLLLIIY